MADDSLTVTVDSQRWLSAGSWQPSLCCITSVIPCLGGWRGCDGRPLVALILNSIMCLSVVGSPENSIPWVVQCPLESLPEFICIPRDPFALFSLFVTVKPTLDISYTILCSFLLSKNKSFHWILLAVINKLHCFKAESIMFLSNDTKSKTKFFAIFVIR